MRNHSLLSASTSRQWIPCPPSARLCEGLPEDFPPWAREGIDAHKLAEYFLKNLLGSQVIRPRGKPLLVPASDARPEWIPAEMDFMDDEMNERKMEEI